MQTLKKQSSIEEFIEQHFRFISWTFVSKILISFIEIHTVYTKTFTMNVLINMECLIKQCSKVYLFSYFTCHCYLLRKFVNWGRSHCIIYSKSQKKLQEFLFYGISLKVFGDLQTYTIIFLYWDILYKVIHKKKIHGVENRRCYLVLVKKISVI